MSFQAYLDTAEAITGRTPNQFIATAKRKKLTEHKEIVAWLKEDFGLGLGHARAIAHVIRNERRSRDGSEAALTGTHPTH